MLEYDTIAFNSATGSGGDLYSNNDGDDPEGFTLSDSIVADGGAPNGGDCNGDAGFVSEGYNVTDGIASTGTATCGFTQSTDMLGDVRLGSLRANGGPTDTEALGAGSPAINLIPTTNANCTGDDQRGTPRPQGPGCDAGALEAGGGETAPQWNPAHDFQTSPMENPSPDSLGNSDVWSYEMSPLADLHEPSNYTLLPTSGLGGACDNLYSWTDDGGVPVVDFNATGTHHRLHDGHRPRADGSDAPLCKRLQHRRLDEPGVGHDRGRGVLCLDGPERRQRHHLVCRQSSTNLASGVNDVGGAGNFAMSSLTVSKGDVLYFILGPAANDDYTYGTTELNLTITEGPPAPSSADLSLSARAQPNPVSAGQTLTDTFTVTNNGPDQSDGVSLSAPVPRDATLSSATASQGSCSGTSTVTCALGSLAEWRARDRHGKASADQGRHGGEHRQGDRHHQGSELRQQQGDGHGTGCRGLRDEHDARRRRGARRLHHQAERWHLPRQRQYALRRRREHRRRRHPNAGDTDPRPGIAHDLDRAREWRGAQSGELEAGGVDVATGQLVIAHRGSEGSGLWPQRRALRSEASGASTFRSPAGRSASSVSRRPCTWRRTARVAGRSSTAG